MDNLNRPQNAQQLIDYQSGSVVSKTILKSKTGTVTLFTFDRGEGLSEHTAPFDALVYVFDGEAASQSYSDVVTTSQAAGNIYLFLMTSLCFAITEGRQGWLHRAMEICHHLIHLVNEKWLDNVIVEVE